MIINPSELLQINITTRGYIPCVNECREIIAKVSHIDYLIESFLNFQIDSDDYLDGINDVGMLDTDDYIEGLKLWLPSPML